MAGAGEADSELSYTHIVTMSAEEVAAFLARGPQEAARLAKAAALHGIVDAQIHWAQMLLDGHGTPRDPAAALRWFSIAAQSRRPDAVNMLGRCHELGWGTAIDFSKAAALYREAADAGYDWAQFNLAALTFAGQGVPRDARVALSLYVRAARQGHCKAMTVIGRYRAEGWGGVRRDIASAARWYRRGAAGDDFRAHFELARLAFDGGDLAAARLHLAPAVEHGVPEFCRDVAPRLLAQSDPAIAALGRRALERACESGDAGDLTRLAEALERGIGGPSDPAASQDLRRRATAADPVPTRRKPRKRPLLTRIARRLASPRKAN